MSSARRLSAFLLAWGLAAPPALAQTPPEFDFAPLQALLAPEREDCLENEGEFLAPDWAFIRHTDFNGDGILDALFDGEHLECEPLASFHKGTGGAPRIVFVSTGDPAAPWSRHDFQAHGHAIVSAPGGGAIPVLLLSLHGSYCDSYGAAACVGAYVWSERFVGEPGFISVAPFEEDQEDEEE
ncbi:hypothetical protein [Neomegalonema sp.]|uniref:hypothetical protein n=1 Tax=Neomegalonema sp. TaxID=2039713 RepID=UPI0026360831|nr:hypothetical protein [Neomegalonema sp.]MDD2869088.1 hypothetical protein [Neomegalonema sp.]